MTVLVHGNPETDAVWDPLVEQLGALGHDAPVRLSPPGFGAPVPEGWGATVAEYHDLAQVWQTPGDGEGAVAAMAAAPASVRAERFTGAA